MTVSIAQTKVLYTGNGQTTQWDIPFPFLDKNDLKVYVVGEYASTQLLTTDYSVDETLSKLTYPLQTNGVAPLPSNQKLLIMRSTPMKQETAFDAQDVLDPSVLEKGYDKAMLIAQELSEQMQRAIKVSADQDATDKTLEEYFQELEEDVAQAQTAATLAESAKQTASSAASAAEQAFSNIQTALAGKQNTLTAGDGISLENDVISSTHAWGDITGSLSDQTDLQATLAAKADTDQLDGSWTAANIVLNDSEVSVAAQGSVSFDISSNFESGKVYELVLSLYAKSGSTSGDNVDFRVSSNLMTTPAMVCANLTRTSSVAVSTGSVLLPYNGGSITISSGANQASTLGRSRITAYRRVK